MLLKTFFLSCVVACSSFCNLSAGNTSLQPAEITIAANQQEQQQDYTYIRVLIDGTWWIIIMDQDGSIIDIIPDIDE